MPRYIDADKKIHIQTFDNEHEEFIMLELTIAECLDSYADEGCPEAADVVERKKGRWLDTREYCGEFTCSNCHGFNRNNSDKWCRHCGADMRKEKTDEPGIQM